MSVNRAIQRATQAANILATGSSHQRTLAIQTMANQLIKQQDTILEANTLDLETSREMAISARLLEWLKLTPERLQKIANDLSSLSQLPDPVGRVVASSQVSMNDQTFTELLPLGVIAFVHESLPDLTPLAAGLCLRSGNSLLLRGSQEAHQTNAAIFQVMQSAIVAAELPTDCLVDLAAQEDYSLHDLFSGQRQANLVIPYGRPSWVNQIVRQCNAPILQSAIGNCYLYWSASGSLETVRSAIIDSHLTQPDAVNGIEKVLLHPQIKQSSLGLLWNSLREHGFEVRGDEALVDEFPKLTLAQADEWQEPYLSKTVAFRRIPRLEDATDWINQNSSGHADSIVTDSYGESQQFAQLLNSTFIYINTSPRFYRLDPASRQIFLGVAKQKGLPRGRIGVDSLMTTKQIIQGPRMS